MELGKFSPAVTVSFSRALPVIACLAILTSAAIAQQPKSAKRNPLSQESAQRGMAQFKQTCAMCHGSEARGGTGPNLIDSSLVRHDEEGSLVVDLLHNGRISKGMPSFPNLADAEVMDLVSFLHAAVEASDNRASASGPARGLTAKRIMTGDAAAGRQFFVGAGKCTGCHSPEGNLKGIAKKYSALELEGRLLYPTPAYETVAVTLLSGESVKGKLMHSDPFYVSLIDSSGNYRSWERKPGMTVAPDDSLKAHRDLLDHYKDKEIHDVFAYLESLP